MADVENGAVQPPAEARVRVAWVAPEMTLLPVSESTNNASVGDDGQGVFTGS
jgi:hypothetical protein